MKKGIALLRVSTSKQDSDYQKELIVKEGEYRNIEILKIFEETISGTKKDRDSLKQMFEFIDSPDNNIDYVITSELSRVGRTREVLEVVDKLNERGISFISIKEGIVTLNEDGTINQTGILIINILQGINQFELSTTSFRSVKGLDNAVAKRNIAVGSANYGYDIIDKHYQINEAEAPVVKQIFDYYGNKGWGLVKIRNWLNSNNIPSKNDVAKWEEGTLRQIVSNPIYKGKRRWNRYKKIVENGKPKKVLDKTIIVDASELKIIDDILFDKCQKRKHRNKNFPKFNKKYDALFDNRIIMCGVCQKHFIPLYRKHLKYNYYQCFSRKHSAGCGNVNIIAEYVDLKIQEHIIENHTYLLKNTVDATSKKDEYNNEIALLENELNKNDEKVKRLKKSFFDLMLIDEIEFKDRLNKFNIEADKVNVEIAKMKQKINDINELHNIDFENVQLIQYTNKDGVTIQKESLSKELLHKIINGIVIERDRVVVNLKGDYTFDFERPPKRWNIDKYYKLKQTKSIK